MHPWLGIDFHEYVAMSGAATALGLPTMLAHYRIAPAEWHEVAAAWNARIPTDPRFSQVGMLIEQEAGRIRAGGALRPVTPQQAFDRDATEAANQIGAAFASIGGAMESLFTSAVMTVGSRVMVQWSDGRRYPATVTAIQSGQVQVAWPNGQHAWVPQHAVSIT